MTINQRIDDFREHTPAIVHDNRHLMAWLEAQGFFMAPASTKYHGSYAGGLYDHSKAVALALQDLTDKLGLQWQRPESPLIVGWFHDLCKIDQYVDTPGQNDEARYAYNEATPLKGHGEKSVMYLAQFMPLTWLEAALQLRGNHVHPVSHGGLLLRRDERIFEGSRAGPQRAVCPYCGHDRQQDSGGVTGGDDAE